MCLASTMKEIQNYSAVTNPGEFQPSIVYVQVIKQQILVTSMSVKGTAKLTKFEIENKCLKFIKTPTFQEILS